MDYETTQEDLKKLRMEYSVLDDIELKIHSKDDIPNHPLKRCVTLYLECFRLGVRLPL